MPTFLVTLATGHQGASTARLLLKAGSKVHALVTDRQSPRAVALEQLGASLYEGSLDNTEVLQRAMTGVEGIFLNFPAGPVTDQDAEPRATQNVVNAALHVGTVKTIVLSTAMDTDKHKQRFEQDPEYPSSGYYSSKHAAEEVLRTSSSAGIKNIVILRPAWFMHNQIAPFSYLHFPELLQERTLATGLHPSSRQPFFNPEDVGKFAAAALLQPEKYAGSSITLADENLTATDMARIMSKVSGVEVKVKHRSDEEIAQLGDKAPPTLQFQLMANRFPDHAVFDSLDHYGIELVPFESFLRSKQEPLRKALGLD